MLKLPACSHHDTAQHTKQYTINQLPEGLTSPLPSQRHAAVLQVSAMPACPYHDSSCGHRGSTNHGNPGQPPHSHFKRHQPRCTMYLLTLDSSLFSASLNVMTLGLFSPLSTPSFLVSPSPFSTVRKKASPIPIPPSPAKLLPPTQFPLPRPAGTRHLFKPAALSRP